ncbi:hypothetical protein EXT64_23165, partial [Pectobacterium atrosepticum]|nr:hypothetical protein [Pectobacterium atrosepticum]
RTVNKPTSQNTPSPFNIIFSMHPIALPLSVAIAALPFLTGSNAQDASSTIDSLSQSQSATSESVSPSGSSVAGGAGGSQPGGSSNSQFQLQEYLTFLNDSGYSSLSSAIQQANETESGQQWLSQLSDGRSTVFAPTNEAFSSVPQEVSSNGTALADYLSYHYVYGDLRQGVVGTPLNGGGGGGGGSGVP